MLGGARAAWPEPEAHGSPAACFPLACSSDKKPLLSKISLFGLFFFFFVEEAQAEVEG